MLSKMQLHTIGIFLTYLLLQIDIYGYVSREKYNLQIVSPVYGKKPYIQVPTAWISNDDKVKIIQTINNSNEQKWKVQIISIHKEKWEKTLKIHPALNIGIYPRTKINKISTVMVYPKDYRKLIEDPLSENPPPISYIGSTRRFIFYYYSENKKESKIVNSITKAFKLKK